MLHPFTILHVPHFINPNNSDVSDFFMHFSGRIAKAVRLAFHDCVGGCNGCIDPDLEDNAGISFFIQLLIMLE